MTADYFFLQWLPQQLRSLDFSERAEKRVSLLVELDGRPYSIVIGPTGARVLADEVEHPTFRLLLDQRAFNKLIAPVTEAATDHGPAIKLLLLDAETIDLMAAVSGSLELRVQDGNTSLSLVFGPGAAEEVGCTVECTLEDLAKVQSGQVQPFELLMNGKLRIEGDAQIAMAFGGVLM